MLLIPCEGKYYDGAFVLSRFKSCRSTKTFKPLWTPQYNTLRFWNLQERRKVRPWPNFCPANEFFWWRGGLPDPPEPPDFQDPPEFLSWANTPQKHLKSASKSPDQQFLAFVYIVWYLLICLLFFC